MPELRKTKIICTLGPSVDDEETLRQLILAGSGNGDSAVTVFGMIVGAAFAHNFALAGNPDSTNDAGELVVGGIANAGKVAVAIGFVVLLAISLLNSRKEATKA